MPPIENQNLIKAKIANSNDYKREVPPQITKKQLEPIESKILPKSVYYVPSSSVASRRHSPDKSMPMSQVFSDHKLHPNMHMQTEVKAKTPNHKNTAEEDEPEETNVVRLNLRSVGL